MVFRRERNAILTILVIFDLTYAFRAIYDIIYAKFNDFNFSMALSVVVVPFFFDLVPICLVLLIHSRNFKTIRSRDVDEREEHGS